MVKYLGLIRKFNRDMLYFYIFWGMIGFGYFGVLAVLANLYLLRLGYSPAYIGMLIGIGQIIWGVLALPAGMIGSRVGVKESQIYGLAISLVGTLAFILAGWLPVAWRDVVLVGGWAISWVGVPFITVNSIPYLMAITTDENRGLGFTTQPISMGLLGFCGSLVAGALPGIVSGRYHLLLDQPGAFQISLLLVPLVYLVGILFFTRARKVSMNSESSRTAPKTRFPLLILVVFGLVMLLQFFGDGFNRAFINVYLATQLKETTSQIGTLLGFGQLMPLLFLGVTPWLISRLGSRSSLIAVSLVCALFLFLVAWAPAVSFVSVGYIGMMSSVAIMGTVRGIFSQEIVSPGWRTLSAAVFMVGNAFGWGIAAWLGGSMIRPLGYQGIYTISGLLIVLSVFLVLFKVGRIGVPVEVPQPMVVESPITENVLAQAVDSKME